jgi:hypothetical protein
VAAAGGGGRLTELATPDAAMAMRLTRLVLKVLVLQVWIVWVWGGVALAERPNILS